MEAVSIFGKMAESFMDNGQIMIWRDMEYIYGVMEEVMKVSTKMIKNLDLVYIIGLMEENMKDGGTKESNTG